jgi:hypothetical protein
MTVETADEFASLLFEEAKAFLEQYRAHISNEAALAYLHAALLLGYCALEAHINSIAADFADRPEMDLPEKSILQEREIVLKNGKFQLSPTLKIFRLEDRYEFLYHRFQCQPFDKTSAWWCQLKAGLDIRNDITHPRNPRIVTEKEVTLSLGAVLESLDVLYKAVYKKPYPSKGRQLDSTITL